MANEIKHDCNKCVNNGYFADFDHSGWHSLCGAGHCYLCHIRMFDRIRGDWECPDFKEGEPPKEVE
jgi:hypothetical protein